MKPYLGLACAALLSVAATAAVAQSAADLSITKTAASATAAPGSNVVYTLTVLNHGPDAAGPVTVDDFLPASLTFVSVTEPGGWSCSTPVVGAPGNVSCDNLHVANGDTAVFTLTTRLAPAAVGPAVTNKATITSPTADPNAANNIASASVTVVVAPPAAVPTLTEWAMILFAALLAGGAALHLQRRRRLA